MITRESAATTLTILLVVLRGVSGNDGVHLMQHSLEINSGSSLELDVRALSPTSNWVTTAFGDCTQYCGQPIETRSVECRSYVNGSRLPDEACRGWAKPGTWRACSCGLQVCTDAATDCKVLSSPTPTLKMATDFETVGCFQRAPEDVVTSACPGPDVDLRDEYCMLWNSSKPCRSGLPFYRSCEARDRRSCFKFCMSKGMDIFGLVGGLECRCGASGLNWQTWRQKTPPPGLRFRADLLTSLTSDLLTSLASLNCPLFVGRYPGHFISGGIPLEVRSLNMRDQTYVHNLAVQTRISPELFEDFPDSILRTPLTKPSFATAISSNPSWLRSCWPDKCGSGAAWSDRNDSAPAGVPNVWQDYVIVRYAFHEPMDDPRKEAFRAAAAAVHAATCIVLMEDPAWQGNRINVGIFQNDRAGCWTNGWGEGLPQLNLGHCNSMAHKGEILHEIGHALGMNHEQMRPDAYETYHGQGPYLSMHWQNVPLNWLSQFLKDETSYTGSADDGAGDPFSGYAAYDFGSIMHYAADSDRFDTIPESSKSLVGQRTALSPGDITQMLDTYQCHYITTTTTTTTSTPPYVTKLKIIFNGTSFEKIFRRVGQSPIGSPIFQRHECTKRRSKNSAACAEWLYHDESCDGGNTTARWIIGMVEPSFNQTADLDNDANCSYWGYIESDYIWHPPLGAVTMQYHCNTAGGCQSVPVVIVLDWTSPTEPLSSETLWNLLAAVGVFTFISVTMTMR